MKTRIWLILILAPLAMRAQEDLPRHAPGETFDFEPKLMLDGPHASVADDSEPDASPPDSPEERVLEMQQALLRAEQRAVGSEQLYKEGILAKVEAEARALAVVKAQKDLADAKLAVAAKTAATARKAFDAHTGSQADLDAANAALKAAQDTDAAASAEWTKGEIEAATADLERMRKLYDEGVGSMQEVELAEDRLTLLTGTASGK